MSVLIALPILGILMIFQTTIVSQVQLLHGTADLLLLAVISWALHKRVQTAWHWSIIAGLMVNIASSLPLGVPVVGYGVTTGLALLLRRRVWRVPILALFTITIFGTLIMHGVSLIALSMVGNPIPIGEALNLITMPSLLLNLLLSVPVYALIGDLANWLYPGEIEV